MRRESVLQIFNISIFEEFKGLMTILNQVYLFQDGQFSSKDFIFYLGKFFKVGHFLAWSNFIQKLEGQFCIDFKLGIFFR